VRREPTEGLQMRPSAHLGAIPPWLLHVRTRAQRSLQQIRVFCPQGYNVGRPNSGGAAMGWRGHGCISARERDHHGECVGELRLVGVHRKPGGQIKLGGLG